MIKKIWPVMLIVSIALMLVFATGVIIAIVISNGGKKNQEALPEPAATSQNAPASTADTILVLGDSIGYGVGDDPDMGIGKRYAALIDPAQTSEVANLSVSGAISADLATLVAAPENAALISTADLIIISIGGNDLNDLETANTITLDAVFQETITSYQNNLKAILNRIRALNPEAQIALIGLYNPYPDQDPQKTQKLMEWNYKTQLLAAAALKTAFIPTDEAFKYHLDSYLAADSFHPSSSGYQVIAETLNRILNGLD